MRLSVVFELLLVFLFLAFAAARVIDPKTTKNLSKGNKKPTTLRQGPPNRYCACTSRMCNCCRDFSLPVVPLKGPGCASIMYVQRDTMMVTMSFGDRVLSNTTISGKTPKPICMALPGGISQFCGRVYGISRKGDQFRACLGLELRALDDIEAALRVSCFKFGPKGVRLESAPPVPAESGNKEPEDDDEDDYDLDDEDDDLIGFGVGDDDDDASSEDNEVDSDSVDYTGFSVLGEDILGTLFSDDTGSSSTKKKSPNKKTAKPQIVVPKTSSTTRRPILPNRRKSTVRPLLTATKRPLVNRITRRPVSTAKPETVKRPTQSVTIAPQSTVYTTHGSSASPVVNTNISQQITKIIVPVTTSEPLSTTMRVLTVTQSEENDKLSSETPIAPQTEQSVTFTVPTEQNQNVKNEIKLSLTDLEKLEAVAAIAQQDVTSGFISSGSVSSVETEKPLETITTKYEKITPIVLDSSTTYTTGNMEKINSVKFIPTTVVTSRPSAELSDDDEESVNDEIVTSSESLGVKKVPANELTTELTFSEEESDKIIGSEEILDSSKIEENAVNAKNNASVSLKKQPLKGKPEKETEKDEEEEEEEEEEDLLEGVLSDDDDSENEEVEEDDESDANSVSTNKDKNQANSIKEEEDEEEDDDDEDDILGEAEETSEEAKPTKVTIKKKPPINNDQEEEEEEEEDILDVLSDDGEEDDDDEEEDSEDDEDSGKPIKKKPTTQATTVRTKPPTTQATVRVKKPVTTTEKMVTTPEVKPIEMVTEKVILYQKPIEQQTEKVIIYQGQEHQAPGAIFIYKEPENEISQKTTQRVIIYNEPVTEKFFIVKEGEKISKPTVVSQTVTDKSVEDTKSDSSEEEKILNSSDESDESSEKQTLMASIIKPGFSNKYAEEHDLAENDDLDIEDTDDEDENDFEEDRKLKQTQKKPPVKSLNKKPSSEVSKPKVLTLSDLIRQRKKYQEQHHDSRPISTSRTHRRMNLDRLLQV